MRYTEWKDETDGSKCRKCGGDIKWQLWESSDGGYEAVHYQCKSCDYLW